MGLGFWSCNFQVVSHIFAEFPCVKACFFLKFLRVKWQIWKISGGGVFRKVYPQPPCSTFPGIAQRCQFCLQFRPMMSCKWCIRYATAFIDVFRNGQNWAKKLIFWLVLWIFLFTPSQTYELHPKILPNWKTLLRYIYVVSFISIAYVTATWLEPKTT